MDDQPTGRGVYVVRRILAVLVILLVLALLVSQAYQALLGPTDKAGSAVQERADVGSSENDSYDEGASIGETGGIDDDAEKEDASDGPSYSDKMDVSDGAARPPRGQETSEDEYGGEESIESDTDFVVVADVLEEVAVGEVAQTVPIPVVDAVGLQAIQPLLSAVPIVSVEPIATAEPIGIEDWIVPEDPTYFDYPVYYEDPAYYNYYPVYYEDPAYYDYYPVYYEEQVFVEPDTYSNADAATASAHADGGAAAYAATGGGVGAYAAISTG